MTYKISCANSIKKSRHRDYILACERKNSSQSFSSVEEKVLGIKKFFVYKRKTSDFG